VEISYDEFADFEICAASYSPEVYPRLKELKIPGDHKIFNVWEDNLASKVQAILDQNN
jgi:hypothetical protein